LLFGTLGSASAGEEPHNLPPLPGFQRARTGDLNNRGQVVGTAFFGEQGELWQAVLWRQRRWKPDTVQPLPTLPGTEASQAAAISRSGIPVGFSFLRPDSFRALVWKRGPGGEWEVLELEPPPGLTHAVATGVNSRGVIVGYAYNPNEITAEGDIVQSAVLWTRRDGRYSVVELEAPDGFQGRAAGINERGDVVGTAERTEPVDNGSFRRSDVVVWRRPSGWAWCGPRSPVVLPSLPGPSKNSLPAINLRGDVVATAEVEIAGVPTARPVYWRRHHWKWCPWKKPRSSYSDPIELPVPEGFTAASAMDINVFGRVAGTATGRDGANGLFTRAVVWSRGHGGGWTVEELDAPVSGLFVSAIRVNDLGCVAGNVAPPPAGTSGALLWKPPWKRCFWRSR
jgi:uncharacterized membrane protein